MTKSIEDKVSKQTTDALKSAYRKHILNDQNIGWDELGDILLNALCEAIGDDEFNIWLEKTSKEIDEHK